MSIINVLFLVSDVSGGSWRLVLVAQPPFLLLSVGSTLCNVFPDKVFDVSLFAFNL